MTIPLDDQLDLFVHNSKGNFVIRKVLIANNGIAAVKFIKSVREWLYSTFKDDKLIRFAVMATPDDLVNNCDYIKMADQYIKVPGGSNSNNHANVDLIVDCCERIGAQAVWAGWGHASENPDLPLKLSKLTPKVAFLGPKESSMYALGDKIASTIVAQAADVPTLPWSGSHLKETQRDEAGNVTVSREACLEACITDVETGIRKANEIGYPVMIKASEGGGGKGIRIVENECEFAMKFAQVKVEVKGSPIFVMKLADRVRHLEVQVFADQYGDAISIFGRDCSVQRRHQKIIEEAPYIIAKKETLHQMEQAAVRLAKLVGYESAGTIEYLYDPKSDQFYFLELNPRLQVEHPTTEMVSGINLPAAQLQVAMGIPLDQIQDIRKFYNMKEGSSIRHTPTPKGHVIAVRITAENPEQGFKPSGGSIVELNFRSNTNCWGYFSVSNLGGLHEFADTQFGHIFAKGESREECRKHMVMALKNLEVRSEFRTTNEYIIKLLETDKFVNNGYYTNWLDELLMDNNNTLLSKKTDRTLAVLCGALYKAASQRKSNICEFKRNLSKGLVMQSLLRSQFNVEFVYMNHRYKFLLVSCAKNTYKLYLNGSSCVAGIKDLKDGGFLVLVDHQSHTVYCTEEAQCVRMIIDGETCVIEEENDPTQLRASSNGKILKLSKKDNDYIKKNESYCEVEVMKMLLSLVCPIEGHISYVKAEGSHIKPGEIIAVISPIDKDSVRSVENYPHQLPPLNTPYLSGEKPHQKLKQYKKTISNYLCGYEQSEYETVVENVLDLLQNKHSEILAYELLDLMSSYVSRLPTSKIPRIEPNESVSSMQSKIDQILPHTKNIAVLHDFNSAITQIKAFLVSRSEFINCALCEFIDGYYDTEILFENIDQNMSEDVLSDQDSILLLRDSHKNDLDKITDIVFSHNGASFKNKVLLCLFRSFNKIKGLSYSKTLLEKLRLVSGLKSKKTSSVALKAKELLISCHYPTFSQRLESMKKLLNESISHDSNCMCTINSASIVQKLSSQDYVDFVNNDTLQYFIFGDDEFLNNAALEVYVRKTYLNYKFISAIHDIERKSLAFSMEIENNLVYNDTDSSVDKIKFYSFKDLSSFSKDKIIVINGSIILLASIDSLKSYLNCLGSSCNIMSTSPAELKASTNIVHISLNQESSEQLLQEIQQVIKENSQRFRKMNIKRLTIMFKNFKYSELYTFRQELNYLEDIQIRHIEPATAYKLELFRLSNYCINPIFVENKQLHFYHSISKKNSNDKRFFIRTYIKPETVFYNKIDISEYLITKGEKLIGEILDSLEILFQTHPDTDCNHLFINFLPTFDLTQEKITSALSDFIFRHGSRLWKLRVTEAEVRFLISTVDARSKEPAVLPIRFIISNYSGFVVKTETYQESYDQLNNKFVLKSLNKTFASRHLQPVLTPYQPKEWLQPKRFAAHQLKTDYVYDYPELFKKALSAIWEQHGSVFSTSNKLFKYKELVLDDNNELKEIDRPPGLNTCGMVAFLFEMYTPEYPSSAREIVVISNDITYKIGSFGPQEDLLFYKATQLARTKGIPRIFISANSGARIGLSEKLRKIFKAQFVDNDHPSKGIDYLYLDKSDYEALDDKKIVNCEYLPTQNHYKINFIVGEEDGIGVECLKGSGLIAGETSMAYKDIFTITLVAGRSVGIGAYLARLGQRVVQNEAQPIILTGYAALNKILGNKVYTSNLQIGGPQIMHTNGISHQVCRDNFEGIKNILKWLSYVPRVKDSFHGCLLDHKSDTILRQIDIEPQQSALDPRVWLGGSYDRTKLTDSHNAYYGTKDFYYGFFDRNSFVETMQGWAKNVICARARLGGLPVGVIAVETRTQELICPADPSDVNSQEKILQQAPQVWYPNSAMKTHQAISDFNNGEQLPLFIFANWRGFSGGQRDMFNEILKFGSYIVDSLTTYKQPIFTYLVPNGELRGGAWAVLDSTINPDMIEMYADEKSRGGIIEKEGLAEIKYRYKHITDTMLRLDPVYKNLVESREHPTTVDKQELESRIKQREKELYPVYSQIALQYVDLHDKPGRMVAKEVVRDEILSWKESRIFFYWRLKRRLNEEQAIKQIKAEIKAEGKTICREECLEILKNTYELDKNNVHSNYEKDNEKVSLWIENRFIADCSNGKEYGIKASQENKKEAAAPRPNKKLDFCLQLINNLPEDQKQELMRQIKLSKEGPSDN